MKSGNNKLKLSILGLLSIRPMTGYELRKNFERSLYAFWPVPLTQIYPTLKIMESDGLIVGEIILQEKRPNKYVYSLTNKGKGVLLNWLKEPSKLKVMHHEFLHKLFLYNLLPLKTTLNLIRKYKQENEKMLKKLSSIKDKFKPSISSAYSESVKFQLLSLDHLIRLTQIEIEGADAIEAELIKTLGVNNSKSSKKLCDYEQDTDDIIF